MNTKWIFILFLFCSIFVSGFGVSPAHATLMELFDVSIASFTDADGDGFYENFTIEIDADMSNGGTGTANAVITDNTGNVNFGPWNITGFETSDNAFVTMYESNYNLATPGVVNVTVTVYDYSTSEYVGAVTLFVPIDNGSSGGGSCTTAYPFLDSAVLAGGVDADGDGYYEEFNVTIDGDVSSPSCSSQVYAVVTDNTGNITVGPWSITGNLTSDNVQVTMLDEWYALASPQNVTVTVTLYDNATDDNVGSTSFSVPVDNGDTSSGACISASPFLANVWLNSSVDNDNDGFYEQFQLGVDADSTVAGCAHSVNVVVTDNTGNVAFGPFNISGGSGANDAVAVTMFDEWYALSTPSNQSVTVELYNDATGNLVDSTTLSIPVDATQGPCASANPYLKGAGLSGGVDANSDGYFEQFRVWIDGATTVEGCPAQVYAEVTDNTGNVYAGPWPVTGDTGNDSVTLNMYDEWYALSDPAVQNVTVTLYNSANDGVVGTSTFPVAIDASLVNNMPSVKNIWLFDSTDADSNGYYEQFQLAIDVDCATANCSADVYSVVSASLGDVTFGPWTVTGWTTDDTFGLSLDRNDYGLPAPATVNVYVTTFDVATGAAIDVDVLAIPIDASDRTPFTWPLTNTEFVQQVYRDFLNREPDPDGLNYWVGQLSAGLSRAELVEQYLLSPEFQGNIAPVARLYFAYFLRIPDYDGLMYWINQYSQGFPLVSISEFFASSDEFAQRYGSLSNSEFVTLVYQNVLGRDPDANGLSFWTSELDSGTRTRGEVMVGFSESPEYQSLMAEEIYVTMTYIGLLRRAPEQGGFDYWVGEMSQGVSGLGLIDGFLNSAEYAARF